MEDVQHRFARELADAIATAVAQSAEVESWRAGLRPGPDLEGHLEATVGFAPRGVAASAEAAPPSAEGEPPHRDHRQRPAFPRSLRSPPTR
jgi:hypothetical protein